MSKRERTRVGPAAICRFLTVAGAVTQQSTLTFSIGVCAGVSAVKGPAQKVPIFRTLGAFMTPYRLAMRSPLHQS